MTAAENIAFGLEMRGVPRAEREVRVRDALTMVGLDGYADRYPRRMSGGQQQRVALARALVIKPDVLLLDEPLSNLDAKLRGTMRAEIAKLHKRLGATFVYVTHDQVEAMTMADRIVVMKDGHIQQVDTPQNLYDHPVNMFVAGFIGAPQMNMLPATIVKAGSAFAARFDGIDLPLPTRPDQDRIAAYEGRKVILGLRPENFHEIAPVDIPPDSTARIEAMVELTEPMGSEVHLGLKRAGQGLTAKVPPRCKAVEGRSLTLTVDMSNAHLFDPDTELSIFAGRLPRTELAA
jgi:multiple sugar transport system ATP-binding protein